MSKTQFLASGAFLSLAIGIALCGAGNFVVYQAQIAGQGSSILMHRDMPATLESFHGAAILIPEPGLPALTVIHIGMALIALGFLFQLFLLRHCGHSEFSLRYVLGCR